MGTRALISAIIVSFFVAGCTPMIRGGGVGTMMMPGKQKAKECKGNVVCFIDVMADGANTGVAPDFVIINNPRNSPILIFFKPDPGVTIEAIDFGDTDGEIQPCGQDGASRQWKCNNLHSKSGVYKYSVKATGLAAKDPWVVND